MRMTCSCGRNLAVRNELIGKRIKCPACGEILTVAEQPPAKASAPRPVAEPTARPKTAPAAPAKARRPAAEDEAQPAAKKTPPPKARPRHDHDEDDDRPRRQVAEDETPAARPRKRRAENLSDEEDELPRPRKKKRGPPASSSRLLWLGVGGGGALVVATAVVLIVVLGRAGKATGTERQAGGGRAAPVTGGGQSEPGPTALADEKQIETVAYAPDGTHLATIGRDPSARGNPLAIKVWDLASGKQVARLQGAEGTPERLAFSQNSKLLAASEIGEIHVWDVGTQRLVGTCATVWGGARLDGNRLLAFNPDGTSVVSLASGMGAVVQDPTKREFWGVRLSLDDTAPGACMPGAPVLAYVAFVPATKRLQLAVFDYLTGTILYRSALAESATAMAFSGDGGTLAVASSAGPVMLFDTRTWSQRTTLARPKDGGFKCYSKINLGPDGTVICGIPVGSGPLEADVWTAGTPPTVRQLHLGPCTDLALSPDGKTIAVASAGKGVVFADPNTGAAKQSGVSGPVVAPRPRAGGTDGPGTPPAALAEEATGPRVVAALGGEGYQVVKKNNILPGQTIKIKGQVAVVSTRGNKVQLHLGQVYTGNEPAISAAQLLQEFTTDRAAAAAKYGGDRYVVVEGVVLQLRPLELQVVLDARPTSTALEPTKAAPDGLALPPMDKQLATDQARRRQSQAAAERQLVSALAKTAAAKRSRKPALVTLKPHADMVACVAFSPDGKLLASCGFHNVIEPNAIDLWDTRTGKRRRSLTTRGISSGLKSVAFSQDGKRLASVSFDGVLQLWDVATGACRKTYRPGRPPTADNAHLVFSPDGRWLVAYGRPVSPAAAPVKIWDLRSDQDGTPFHTGRVGVTGLAFRPDSRVMATADATGSVRFWDPATRREVSRSLSVGKFATGLSFAPDGSTIAALGAAGKGTQLFLCDLVTGSSRSVASWEVLGTGPDKLAFTPDGALLAVIPHDRRGAYLQLLDPSSGQVRGDLRRVSSDSVACLAFSPGGVLCATGTGQSVTIWLTKDLLGN